MVKGRLRQLEKAFEDYYTVVLCDVCGAEVRASGDLALRCIASSWSDSAGQHRLPDAAVDAILSHPHDAIRDELFRDLYGVAHAG